MKPWLCLLLLLLPRAETQPVDGWPIFARVKFTEKFYRQLNEYYLVPLLDTRIRYYEGKEITLKGHYMPFEMDGKQVIVISKFPYSMCFFCGGAGPESVAEVVLSAKRPKLKTDQLVTVTGTLKLNGTDINHLNFILEQATLETP